MTGFRRNIDTRIEYGIAWTKATGKPLDYESKEDFINWLMKSYKMTEAIAEGCYDEWDYRHDDAVKSARRFVKKLEERKAQKEKFEKRFEDIERAVVKIANDMEKNIKAETRK